MTIGLNVGQVLMTDMYDATNLRKGRHQIQDHVNIQKLGYV